MVFLHVQKIVLFIRPLLIGLLCGRYTVISWSSEPDETLSTFRDEYYKMYNSSCENRKESSV